MAREAQAQGQTAAGCCDKLVSEGAPTREKPKSGGTKVNRAAACCSEAQNAKTCRDASCCEDDASAKDHSRSEDQGAGTTEYDISNVDINEWVGECPESRGILRLIFPKGLSRSSL